MLTLKTDDFNNMYPDIQKGDVEHIAEQLKNKLINCKNKSCPYHICLIIP